MRRVRIGTLAVGLAAAVILASCASSGGAKMDDMEAHASDFQDYQSWNKVNSAPITGDVFGVLGEAHHGTEGIREVFINNVGKKVSDDGSGFPYPVGTMIVKEAYAPENKDVLQLLTMMVKRGPGFDPGNGDWEYFMTPPDFSDTENMRGAMPMCIQCHSTVKRQDYVFHNGVTTAYLVTMPLLASR